MTDLGRPRSGIPRVVRGCSPGDDRGMVAGQFSGGSGRIAKKSSDVSDTGREQRDY